MNTPRQTSSAAIISLVFGILSWLVVPVIGALVAIISGHMARSEIRRSAGTLDGDGMALTGLVLGWLHIIAFVLFVAAMLLFFGGFAALMFWQH